MIKRICPTLFIFLLVFQSLAIEYSDTLKGNNARSIDPKITIDVEKLRNSPRMLLKYGQQKLIKQGPFRMDIGYGKTNCLLFEIPVLKNDSINFEFRSLVENSQLYYPIFIILNDDYEVQETITTQIKIEGSELYGMYYPIAMGFDTSTRYILVTTDLALKSKSINHIYETQNSSAIYTGSTIIYVPIGSSTVNKNIRLTDDPRFLVWVSTATGKKPFKRENGIYWGLGVCFGGDEVTDNPSGDNYRAGGGAVITLGFTHSLFSSNFVGRYGGGIRYQGSQDGDARNLGYLTEVVVSYQTKYINFGVGGQLDFGNSTRDLDGKEYNFETALGPKFVFEGRFKGMLNLGLEYILMDFTTTDNEEFNGNRVGFSLKFFFGR